MKLNFFLSFLLVINIFYGQKYFPPNNSNDWETINPVDLNWCNDNINNLYNFLEQNDTKAFILLKDGKIVLEQYFDGFLPTANWYWASAGKTLTAVMTGIAQQEGFLSLNEPTATYLGNGWTSCTPTQEQAIKVRNQLTMTSGLDDGVAEPGCTDPACLTFLAPAGTRWAYHNGPYTLLDQVIENATGQTLNTYTQNKLKSITGMDGIYINQGFNKVFFSTPRSMARFGLLMLNQGIWNNTPVLNDMNYFNEMVNTTQSLNQSYGYLWWLNGKDSYMLPTQQFVFPGSIFPDAPEDTFAGLGADGQFINVIPSQNIVWIRMGEAPKSVPVPYLLNNEIWSFINQLPCNLATENYKTNSIKIYPNPTKGIINIKKEATNNSNYYQIYNSEGSILKEGNLNEDNPINIEAFAKGIYFLQLIEANNATTFKIIKH